MWRGFRRATLGGLRRHRRTCLGGWRERCLRTIMSCLLQTFARSCSGPPNAGFMGNVAVRSEELEIRVDMKRPAVDDTAKQKLPVRCIAEKAVIGSAIVGGSAASILGVAAAGSSATAAISAAGAAVGAVAGGVMGSSIGMVTGGVGIAATGPLAVAGAALGGWAGPALALIGIGTAPVWAVPLAVVGGVFFVGGVAAATYKFGKSRSAKKDT